MPHAAVPSRQDVARLNKFSIWFPPVFYLLLAAVFLYRTTFVGDVFLPAGLLGYIAPYQTAIHAHSLPPWNPLRWDGIAQFYPWRLFAARTVRSGLLPLWNPYQFCGAPFVANSQSAVFYPPNLLFDPLPTTIAFNLNALLHLTLCGWFTYLFLKQLRCSTLSSLLGGCVYAYSAWQVQWLQLPTFLATSCWFPLVLRQLYRLLRTHSAPGKSLTSAGASIGLMLLAGHLQIAFYGLLAASLWSLALLIRTANERKALGRSIALSAGAFLLGGLLCAVQLLPTLELSRLSHRATQATTAGYQEYVGYALQPYELTTLFLPNLTGNDYDPQNHYWGFYLQSAANALVAVRHNAAETALYVGILPLLLAALAVYRALQRQSLNYRALFFVLLAVLALLMALGTPLDALFYFGIPGFGASGSPARILVLWALAIACLAAFGLDYLLESPPNKRALLALFAVLLAGFGLCLFLVSQALSVPLPGFDLLHVPTFSQALSRIPYDWVRLGAGFILASVLFWQAHRRSKSVSFTLAVSCLAITIADLFWTGIPINPVARPAWVYPRTPGIRYLQAHLGHERIFPINRFWSLDHPPPAVLPPNGAMVYQLRDVQGYDSLFPGQLKAYADQFARPNRFGVSDASPPEVGNMVFFQNPNAPLLPTTSARYAVALPTDNPAFANVTLPPSTPPLSLSSDDLTLYLLSSALPRARFLSDNPKLLNPPVTYLQDLPTRVVLRVTALTSGLLILADENYPGWEATVDKQPVPILTPPASQGSLFRAVHLAPGNHIVAFQFQPSSFNIGLYLSLTGLLILCWESSKNLFRSRKTM
ncbi:hypothetical protein CWRG_00282 [Chthonomonas calidirosea]|nr:hypothetical protein CWRG_00282 [Chthonomonas calidirosea]